MRIGLAGAGRIGALHAATLRRIAPSAQLLIHDPDSSRAAGVAATTGASTVDDLLAHELDALIIAAPTPHHPELLRHAMQAGWPVFCEKPPAPSLKQTLELARQEAECAAWVQVGFQRRFDAGYARARSALASGELGRLHTVRANTFDEFPPPASYLAHCGGIFHDCSVHDIDAVRFVTGREVVRVYAVDGPGESASAILTLEDDTPVHISAARRNGSGYDVRLELLGERCSVGVGLDDTLAVRPIAEAVPWPHGPVVHDFISRFLPAYQAELEYFVRSLTNPLASPCSVSEAAQAARVAEACDRSRATGQPVELSEVEDL